MKTAHSLEDKCRDYCNRAEEWIEENRAFLELEGYENPSLRNLPEGVYPFSRNIKWCSHWSEKWLGFAADLKRMELKVIRPRELVMTGKHNEPVYLKSDADAVIADLENKLQNESRLLKETREWLIASQKLHKKCADNAVKIIRRSNRKYCLEVAMTCSRNIDLCICDTPDWPRGNVPFWQKWRKRWLELAEKYKPNNSTAR